MAMSQDSPAKIETNKKNRKRRRHAIEDDDSSGSGSTSETNVMNSHVSKKPSEQALQHQGQRHSDEIIATRKQHGAHQTVDDAMAITQIDGAISHSLSTGAGEEGAAIIPPPIPPPNGGDGSAATAGANTVATILDDEDAILADLDFEIQRAEEDEYLDLLKAQIRQQEMADAELSPCVLWTVRPGEDVPLAGEADEMDAMKAFAKKRQQLRQAQQQQQHKKKKKEKRRIGSESLVEEVSGPPKVRLVKRIPWIASMTSLSLDYPCLDVSVDIIRVLCKSTLGAMQVPMAWLEQIEISIRDDPSDKYSCYVVLEGPWEVMHEKIREAFKQILQKILKNQTLSFNIACVLGDPMSKEVDIPILAGESLNAKAESECSLNREKLKEANSGRSSSNLIPSGVFVGRIKPQSPLHKYLSVSPPPKGRTHATSVPPLGFIIMGVNGKLCPTLTDYKLHVRQAKETRPSDNITINACVPSFVNIIGDLTWTYRGDKSAAQQGKATGASSTTPLPHDSSLVEADDDGDDDDDDDDTPMAIAADEAEEPTSASASPIGPSATESAKQSSKKANGTRKHKKPKPSSNGTNGVPQRQAQKSTNDARLASGSEASSSSAPAAAAVPEAQKNRSKTNGRGPYTSFELKTRQARLFEFGEAGIHSQKSASIMWTQHKIQFGADSPCDEDCECPYRLPTLCEDLIEKHITNELRSKKKSVVDREARGTGFMQFFAKTFIPYLREEYPDEGPIAILKRLEEMWPLHKAQRNFGLRCKKNCLCSTGWEMVFKCGDPKGRNKTSRPKPSTHVAPNTALPFQPLKLVPVSAAAAASKVPAASSRKPQSSLLGSLGKLMQKKMNQPKLDLLGNLPVKHRNPRKLYEVTFDTKKPLGAYYMTSRVEKYDVCKIYDIFPKGQHQKDKRVSVGSIVLGAFIPGAPLEGLAVRDGAHLSKKYEAAKNTNQPITLIMTNTDVRDGNNQGRATMKNWSATGAWQGKATNGWPGGAPVSKPWHPKPFQPNQGHATQNANGVGNSGGAYYGPTTPQYGNTGMRPGNEHSNQVPHHNQDQAQAQSSEMDTLNVPPHLITNRQPYRPNHRSAAPTKSLLRAPRSVRTQITQAQPRTVSINEDRNEFKLIAPPQIVNNEQNWEQNNEATEKASCHAALKDAVRIGTVHDVIAVLETSGSAMHLDFKNLKVEHDYIKQVLEGSSNFHRFMKLTKWGDEESARKDLVLKRKVVILNINARQVISQAMTLRHWRVFDFHIRSINTISQRNFSRHQHGKKRTLTLRFHRALDDKHRDLDVDVPERQFADWISFDTEDRSNRVTFRIHNNHGLRAIENRILRIVLYSGPQVQQHGRKRLCSISVPMTALEEKWKRRNGNGWCSHHASFHYKGRDEELKGNVAFEFRSTSVAQEYVQEKIAQARHKIVEVLDDINRFNTENHMPLSCDIKGVDNQSLLHAAIQLRDAPLVEKLVKIGADPHAESNLGSPIDFAQKQLSRAEGKTTRQSSNGGASERRKWETIVKCLCSAGDADADVDGY